MAWIRPPSKTSDARSTEHNRAAHFYHARARPLMQCMSPQLAFAARRQSGAGPQLAKADFASSSQHVRERQRIAMLFFASLSGAAGKHGDVRILRKETRGR
jgi:hypothetical protein